MTVQCCVIKFVLGISFVSPINRLCTLILVTTRLIDFTIKLIQFEGRSVIIKCKCGFQVYKLLSLGLVTFVVLTMAKEQINGSRIHTAIEIINY